jgi:hypothetical protein
VASHDGANAAALQQMPANPERRALVGEWLLQIEKAEAATERSELGEALAHVNRAARLAERLGGPQRMFRTGRALEALSLWGPAARLMAMAERIEEPDGLPEWDGASLPGATLLIVERRGEHIGRPLRFARFIPMAAARVKRCIVLVEPRLVALFRRSFPDVEVHPRGIGDAKAHATADVVAGYRTLTRYFGFDDDALRAGFAPLRHDEAARREMRIRYRWEARPLIGVSWMSTNAKKQVPSLTDWAGLMRSLDASFVSLQYGDVAGDSAALREASGATLICDERVDPLRDLDAYANQVAAMDAVVSISGTCVHMAGALGMPTFVPLDDTTRLYWPAAGSSVSWYPTVTFFRRGGRPWGEAIEQVRTRVALFPKDRLGRDR